MALLPFLLLPPAEQDQRPFVPSAAQDQRSMAISAAVSAQVADAVHAQVRGQQERARSMAISAAISTQVADAVYAQVRGQHERAREHERQLRSEAISAAVEEARRTQGLSTLYCKKLA